MKKFLVLALLILVVWHIRPAEAQERGALTNVFASSFSVGFTQKNVQFPFNSRDLNFINNSTVQVCVSPNMATIGNGCVNAVATNTTIFVLAGGDQLNLYDYVTNGVSFRTSNATISASPISVIATY